MTAFSWSFVVLGAVALTALSAVLAWRARGAIRRRQTRQRFERGRHGEQAAARLLAKAGYAILEEQLTRRTGFWVDEHWREVDVRADFLASRNGSTYVVEVKTGRTASNPSSTATRRQLLEYSLVYQADGLLLADMETGRLRRIRFDVPIGQTPRRGTQTLAVWAAGAGVLVGLGIGLWLVG